jgi:hypothetical protein
MVRRWNAAKGLNRPLFLLPASLPAVFKSAEMSDAIPPLYRCTRKQKETRSSCGSLSCQHESGGYGASVTTQKPGVARVNVEIGWVSAPPVPTSMGPNNVVMAFVLVFR